MKDIPATKLELRRLIPPFSLESAMGQMVSPWDYKEKKPLLILFFDPTDSAHLAALAGISKRYHELADADAEVLAIASGPIGLMQACVEGFRPPFPILADVEDKVRQDYGASGLAMFVTDRFGELRMAVDVGDNPETILDTAITVIELSEQECPECGVSTWPEA